MIDLDPTHPVKRDETSGLVSGLCAGRAPPLRRERMGTSPEAMIQLHRMTGWTPGFQHIRPSEAVLEQKEHEFVRAAAHYQSAADWVYHDVFGTATRRASDGRRIADLPAVGSVVLSPQPFP